MGFGVLITSFFSFNREKPRERERDRERERPEKRKRSPDGKLKDEILKTEEVRFIFFFKQCYPLGTSYPVGKVLSIGI